MTAHVLRLARQGSTRSAGLSAEYAFWGTTVRAIQGHLKDLSGTETSPDLISRLTDAVLKEVKAWQSAWPRSHKLQLQ